MPITKLPPDFPEPPKLSKRYLEDFKWVNDTINELTEKYPDQWIAVLEKEVIIASKDLGLVKKVARQRASTVGRGPCVYTLVEAPWRFRRSIGISDSGESCLSVQRINVWN
jgi:hypothetical protein